MYPMLLVENEGEFRFYGGHFCDRIALRECDLDHPSNGTMMTELFSLAEPPRVGMGWHTGRIHTIVTIIFNRDEGRGEV